MPKPKINLTDKSVAENIAKEVVLQMQKNPGMTLKQATGVSEEVLEEIYHMAYTYYNLGKYQEAAALFQFLAGSSPHTFKYIFGLAGCFHQTECFEQAAIGFFIALNIEPHNPIAAYYLTDCFLKQDLPEEALEMAELTFKICKQKSEYSELAQRSKLIVEALKRRK